MALPIPRQQIVIPDPVWGNVTREYIALNPNDHDKVLFLWHGGGGSPEIFIAQTGLLKLLVNDLINFGVVLPAGIQYNPSGTEGHQVGDPSCIVSEDQRLTLAAGAPSNAKVNGGLHCDGREAVFTNFNGFVGFDDILFANALIQTFTDDVAPLNPPYHPSRVAVGGGSNGGNFVQRLAIEHPELVTAGLLLIAASGGLEYVIPALPGPLAVMDHHGTKDPLLEWNGGDRSGDRWKPITLNRAFWKKNNGIGYADPPDSIRRYPDRSTVDKAQAVRKDWTSGLARYVEIDVEGGGHTASQELALPDSNLDDERPGATCQDFNIVREFCAFSDEVVP